MTNKAKAIREYLKADPKATNAEVAKALNTTPQYVASTKYKMPEAKRRKYTRKYTRKAVWDQVAIAISKKPLAESLPVQMIEPPADPVNHPAHYKVGGIETIDFIEAKKLNYNLGNAVKYITRADHKGNRKQDLEKAIWYLNRELSHA